MDKTYINFEIINDIKNNANIVDVIGSYIKLKKKGSSYFGLCPFHNDNHPSLSVSPNKKIFKCFVCGAKGNVFNFVSKYENINFFESVIKVAKLINYDLTKLDFLNQKIKRLPEDEKRLVEANFRCNVFYNGFLFNEKYKKYLSYLHNRGLNNEIIKHFFIGFAPNEENLITDLLTNKNDIFGDLPKDKVFNLQELLDAKIIIDSDKRKFIPFLMNRITFPIFDENNNLVAFSGRLVEEHNNSPKYLHSSDSKIFHKNKILYNLNNLKNKQIEELIIVEGFMDVIAFFRANVTNVVATMGTSLTTNHILLIQSIKNLNSILLSFDNDQAGIIATINVGKELLDNGFRVYVANYGSIKEKDPDEIINNLGSEQLNKIIGNKEDYVSFLIKEKLKDKLPLDKLTKTVDELLDNIIDYGDLMLRTEYLKLLSGLSNLNFDDLMFKYNFLFNKKYSLSKVYINKNIVDNDLYENSMKLLDENYPPNKTELENLLNFYVIQMNKCKKNMESILNVLITQSIFIPNSILIFFDDVRMCLDKGIDISQSKLIKIIENIVKKSKSNIDSLMLIENIRKYNDNTDSTKKAISYFEKLISSNVFENPFEKNSYSINIEKRIKDNVLKLKEDRYKLIFSTYITMSILAKQKCEKGINKEENNLLFSRYMQRAQIIIENLREFLRSKK